MGEQRICSVEGCRNKLLRYGLCEKHYKLSPLRKKIAPKGAGLAFLRKAYADDIETCVLWPFGKDNYGYGIMGGRGKNKAHRVICIWKNGPPPFRLAHARHTCGNPACVNKHHLIWGTSAQNYADAVDHGTACIGTKRKTAKLTDDAVREIRTAAASDRAYADRFGVSEGSVRQARIGKRWRHVV